jgi:hypothetical protein
MFVRMINMQIQYFMKRDSNAANVDLYVYKFQHLFYILIYIYATYTTIYILYMNKLPKCQEYYIPVKTYLLWIVYFISKHLVYTGMLYCNTLPKCSTLHILRITKNIIIITAVSVSQLMLLNINNIGM